METTEDDDSIVLVPEERTLSKNADTPSIAVTLPAVFGVSTSSFASTGLSLIALVVPGAFLAAGIPDSVGKYLHAGLPFWRFLFQISTDVIICIVFLYLISTLVWEIYCAFASGRNILTISRQGIVDLRVSNQRIDWQNVENAQPRSYRGSRRVRLRLKSGAQIRLRGPGSILQRFMPWPKSTHVDIEIDDISGEKNTLTNLIVMMVEKSKR